MSPEHCHQLQEEEEAKEEEPWDECEGSFPDSHYPPPPNLEEQIPNDLPQEENQEQPPEDEWFCLHCENSPCLFIQWQEELERHFDIMYPEVTNKAKRYHIYRHIFYFFTFKLHAWPLFGQGQSKGQKPLPGCFQQGPRDLFPSEDYTGFKPSLL
jgi:hypothetical protein